MNIIEGLFQLLIFNFDGFVKIFNPNPLDFNTVVFTYILGTYASRIFIALLDTPIIYLAKIFLPNK